MTADFLPAWPPAANSFALFGLLLLAGLLGGRAAATTRVLPAITGYILTGFILGPGVLGWLTEDALADTRIFADISLGIVVFELGRRLDLEWARHDRWLLPTGLAESLLSFAAMFALLVYFDVPKLEAAVAATIGVATAPAVVLLVAAELKAEGPATRRALWHVALNNIVAHAWRRAAAAVRRGARRRHPVEPDRARAVAAGRLVPAGLLGVSPHAAARPLRRQGRRLAIHPDRRDDRAHRRGGAGREALGAPRAARHAGSARATSIPTGA